MAQVAAITVTEEWTSVASLISSAKGETFTFDATKNYFIENHGTGLVFLAEPSAAPESTDIPYGVILRDSNKVVKYKTGTNTLYARSTGGQAVVNVTVGE